MPPHIYDEHGLCFECDKPALSPAQRQQRRRDKKKADGLTKLELWVRPEHVEKLKQLANELLKNG